jgi:serine phosphatase RsbU (regulator of sigma subunit)
MIIRCIFVFLLLLYTTFLWSKTKDMEAIKQEAQLAKNDSDKIKIWIKKAIEFEKSAKDSAFVYYQKAVDLALGNMSKLEKNKDKAYYSYVFLASDAMYNAGVASTLIYHAENTIRWNKEAIAVMEKYIQKFPSKFDVKNRIATALLNVGNGYSFKQDYILAIQYYQKSLSFNRQMSKNYPDSAKLIQNLKKCYYNLSVSNTYIGKYTEAIQYCDSSLIIANKMNDPDEMAQCYMSYGMAYAYQCNYEKAIDFNIKALNIKESLLKKDPDNTFLKKTQAKLLGNIALIYSYNKYYKESIDYFMRSIEIKKSLNDTVGLASVYINMAGLYFNMEQYQNSLRYYEDGLSYATKCNDMASLSNAYHGIGINYSVSGMYFKAIESIQKAIAIQTKMNNLNGLALSLNSIAKDYLSMNDTKKAIEAAEEALRIGQNIKSGIIIKDAYSNLIDAYEKMGNYTKGFYYFKLYNAIKDSVFNQEKSKQIAEMENKYQSEKKQFEISSLTKEKELQTTELKLKDVQLKKQLLLITSFVIGFFVILVFSIIIYKQYLAKKKANKLLEQKNMDIHLKKEEIVAQRDEIEAQRDELQKQNAMIAFQKKEIMDSINYACRIQTAIMPPDYFLKSLLPNHFIFYQPKDVVSGDFYYAEKTSDGIVFSAVDCTGHGVPGAMMSVIGYNILNQAVKINHITKPSAILQFLDTGVTQTLRQMHGESGVSDGMDIAVCLLNNDTQSLQYAGAYNSLIYTNKGALHEIKADKFPIGVNYDGHVDEYTNHQIQLERGDMVYLYSDGYADQFGEKTGKKFKYKPLRELLLGVHTKSEDIQKEIIIQTFENWKGCLEQVDDVLVFAVKV